MVYLLFFIASRAGMALFQLELLPSQLVGLIAEQSYNLVGLWKCGSPLLTSKLIRGVTRVDLKDDDWTSTSRWPKLLSSLTNLRSLSITREAMSYCPLPQDLSQAIRSLSPTLQELNLSFLYWDTALLNYDLETGEVIQTQYERGVSQWFDINSHFPALEKVAFIGATSLDFRTRDIAALPDTIFSIKLPRLDIVAGEDNLCALLPRKCESLVSIFLNLESAAKDTLPFFPPSLTHLEDLLINRASDVAYLPRRIETGRISFGNFPWDPVLAVNIPPLIDHLFISEIAANWSNWAEALPKRLRNLTLSSVASLICLDASLIALLPRTLTTLETTLSIDYTSLLKWSNSKGALPWPPELTTLGPDDQAVSHETLTHQQRHFLLPRSLTKLSTIWNDAPSVDWSGLPPSLASLIVNYKGQRIISFPKPPTHLTVVTAQGNFVRSSFNDFPSSLICLYCDTTTNFDMEANDCLRLPPNLESLLTSRWNLQFHLLPRSITRLSLTDVRVPPRTTAVLVEESLMALPPSIEMVSLSSLNWNQSISRFAILPQLLDLDCSKFGRFQPSALRSFAHSKHLISLKVVLTGFRNEADFEALVCLPHLGRLELGSEAEGDPIALAQVWPIRTWSIPPFIDKATFQQRFEDAESNLGFYPDPRISRLYAITES